MVDFILTGMEATLSEAEAKTAIPTGGFDYCFWSKLLVAIVLFPMVAWIAAFFFTNVILKIVFALLAIAAIVRVALWIDRIPCLLVKIPALIGRKS